MIQCSSPKEQLDSHRAAIDNAIARVLDRGWYVLGEEVAAFESEFSAYCNISHAIGVNSGTDALALTLRALGIKAGDEVITVSHTAVATVAAIEQVGALPVLVDIDPDLYTIDPIRFEAAISPATRAVIPVHLYGQPADMDAVLAIAHRHGLKVIEDCAQATGAIYRGRRVGTLGDAGCFSFYPTKNLGGIGDGGMVVTANPDVAARLRSLREYGWQSDRTSHIPGFNSRLDELQAAILRAKLPHLDTDNARRIALADGYDAVLADRVILPTRRSGCSHVFHLYVVRSAERDSLLSRLRARDIGAAIHYPMAVHQQPAYAGRLRCPDGLAVTEKVAAEIITLPLFPELGHERLALINKAVLAETTPRPSSNL